MKISANDKFWGNFAKNFWETKSVLVKNFECPILEIDQKEIFEMLVSYSNKCRKLKSSDGFKLYIDGQMLHPSEVLEFLPVKSDKNLVGYNKRMEEYFKDYCLVCDELLQSSQKNWAKLHQFTDTLFSHVGFPNRFVEMGLYLGNYRKTPFGVHVDGCGVFSFPVIGKKVFRLWEPSFAKKNPSLDRTLHYNRFKKSSTTMKATAGDMTYWPSSAWHIAESDGSFNATWSLGVWVDRTHIENVEASLKPLLKKKHGPSGAATVIKDMSIESTGKVDSLPESYLKSILSIKNISEAELHDTFMQTWLKLLSMHGFKNSYGLTLSFKISVNSKIQLPKSKKVIWAHLKSRQAILYAFEGQITEAAVSKNIQNLVTDLNSGLVCKISRYLKGQKKSQELQHIKDLFAAHLIEDMK